MNISPSPPDTLLQARWVLPAGEQWLSPGCVLVREGRIVRVWEGSDAEAVDLGDVAIVPGLINAHTHLEFSDLAQPLAAGTVFPDWIRAVIQSRRARPAGFDVRSAIRRGWEEGVSAGTAAVGEIATANGSFDELTACGGRGVVYRELLGLQDEAVAAGCETARQFLSGRTASPELIRGLSPHAPYSLHPDLFRGLIDVAVETGAPVAMHLAETREELDLLVEQRGGLVELLRSLGLWRAGLWSEFHRPLDYLRELARCRTALVVHGNYLAEDELDFLATQPQMSVVYCPRTHAAFGHAPHPWRAMRARGIRVVVGTDSRASNPDLSMLHELQWLQARHPDVPASELLRMATLEAAEALGLAAHLGTIEPGKRAAFAVIQPSRPLLPHDWSGLFS